ncbi:hypothetical protein PAXRUDRAFT_143287 [Paxillus rubicundulus Ve08.2h10]|uniref:Uncharacterized protein n=1 Tax=Paxillus rubicundulus Ve08.2h10 TaxID=930991 RepID=A0A0D0E7Q5_9AGAM|nr:hypothetical protein PAXRUDRAFT_143287 [Paxillus rubicundulus Ve08.2h10]
MADSTSTSSPSPPSSPSPSSIPSWAIFFIVIAFLAFVISNRIRPRRRLVDDIERQHAEMAQRSREGVDETDAASITTVVGPPPPVYAPKSSSPEPPLYRSAEDARRGRAREDGALHTATTATGKPGTPPPKHVGLNDRDLATLAKERYHVPSHTHALFFHLSRIPLQSTSV